MEFDPSLSVRRVVRALEQAGELCGLARLIVMDNRPELTSRVLGPWAYGRGVELILSGPGKPLENAYAERLNRRVREECLTQRWLEAAENGRELCLAWRDDYNAVRPHTYLGSLPPSEFLLQLPGGHARPGAAALPIDPGNRTDGGESNYLL
jgi:putative transposase